MGQRIGTLCVIDQQPRTLSERQIESLQILGRAVVTQLELRKARLDFEALSQALPVCAWCHSVRTTRGQWLAPEDYLADAVAVTHGICPRCTARFKKDPS